MIDQNLLAAVLAIFIVLGAFTWRFYPHTAALAIQCWWANLKWRLGFRSSRSWWEGRAIDLAWLLPRSVAYWAFIRVFSYASTVGEGRGRHPDSLTYSEVAKAWKVRA